MQYMVVYQANGDIRREERCTLRRFIELGRLVPGLILTLSNGEEAGYRESVFKLVVGDCTPFIGLCEPANSEDKKWDEVLNKEVLDQYVIEVQHLNLSLVAYSAQTLDVQDMK